MGRRSYSYDRSSRSRSSSGSSIDNRKALNEDILTKMSNKKIFIEEVGVSWKSAFREDTKGDKTNLSSRGLYSRDVARYKTRVKIPMGKSYQQHTKKLIDESPRFFHKQYAKQIKRTTKK